MEVGFIKFWLASLRLAWNHLRNIWGQIVLGYLGLPVADLLIYFTSGRKLASDWVWSSAMTQVFPLTIIGLIVTLFVIVAISPYLLHRQLLAERNGQLQGLELELTEKKGQVAELTRRAIIATVREGDNRYLYAREHESGGHVVGREYVGRFSVGVAPDRARTVENVNVEIKDISMCGTDFRNVKLRFDGQVQAGPVDINPGETKFITIVGFTDRGRNDDPITIRHAGQDGYGGLVSTVPKANRYVAKIYITGRDMRLLPFHIAFGVERGEFYLSQVDD